MAFDDLFAYRQTYTSSGVLFASMKTLKNHENTVEILGFDANPIVAHRKNPFAIHGISLPRLRGRGLQFRGNLNAGRGASMKLHGVTNQVLEKLDQLRAVAG